MLLTAMMMYGCSEAVHWQGWHHRVTVTGLGSYHIKRAILGFRSVSLSLFRLFVVCPSESSASSAFKGFALFPFGL